MSRTYTFTKDDNFGKFYLAAKDYNVVKEAYHELPEMQCGDSDVLLVIMPKELVAMCQLVDTLEELGFKAVATINGGI